MRRGVAVIVLLGLLAAGWLGAQTSGPAFDVKAATDAYLAKVPAAEKNELLGLLAPMKGDIVETKGTATGTALPPAFKPAPPMKKKVGY